VRDEHAASEQPAEGRNNGVSEGILVLVSATFLASCAAASDADPGLYEEPVSSAQESLTSPGVVVVSREFENEDFAVLDACPSNLPYVLGAGFYAVGASANDLYSQADGVEAWDSKVVGKATSNASFLEIFATCSNARGTKRFSDIGNGDATANCQSGEVAVGGGAICNDSSAHLYRSRPNPDADESEPTGWRAPARRAR
jgi:hypothetical protein